MSLPSLSHGDRDDRRGDGLGASLFDASEDCVKIVDLDGRLMAMNANGICLMEVDDFEALRGEAWDSLWPEEQRPKVLAAVADALAGRGAKFVAECPTAKGTPRSWEVVVWPVLDDQGTPTRIVSISRDITERLRTEADRALHTRELSHRIKNMFAVVDGVIALSARATREAGPFAEALRHRLAGLGRAIAYVSPDETDGPRGRETRDLHGLLRVMLEAYGRGQIAVEGDDRPVALAAMTPLALIINELATNAVKYGALRAPEGRIRVRTTVTDDQLRLLWEEEGAPIQPLPEQAGEGFGSILLQNAVVRQLGGGFEREWTPTGLVFDMRFPLPRISG